MSESAGCEFTNTAVTAAGFFFAAGSVNSNNLSRRRCLSLGWCDLVSFFSPAHSLPGGPVAGGGLEQEADGPAGEHVQPDELLQVNVDGEARRC